MNRRQWLCGTAMVAAGAMLPSWQATAMTLPYTTDTPIRLRANENPYGPSPRALEAMQVALRQGNRYGDSTGLRQQIAEREGLTPDHVVITHGSFEALCLVAQAYAHSGTEVIVPDPTFGVFGRQAALNGAYVHEVPLDAAFANDLQAMRAHLAPRTSVVYICNPNNPTGGLVPAENLRAFLDGAMDQALALVDEAYHEYVEDPRHASMVPLVQQGGNVVVLRTFSKLYGLAGMRIGYALARPDIAARLRTMQCGPISTLGLAAAEASYADTDFVTMSRERNTAARAALYRALDEHGFTYPQAHGNFVWVDFGQPMAKTYARLQERGIAIAGNPTSQAPWGRVTIGTDAEMARFAEALPYVLVG